MNRLLALVVERRDVVGTGGEISFAVVDREERIRRFTGVLFAARHHLHDDQTDREQHDGGNESRRNPAVLVQPLSNAHWQTSRSWRRRSGREINISGDTN